MPSWVDELLDDEEGPAIKPRRLKQDTELDMTPMIDCTFLLLIFFTVGANLEPQAAVELPPARYGTGVDPDKAVTVTIALADESGSGWIYLGDGKVGAPLSGDEAAQAAAIREAVTASGKQVLLIKAERLVHHREVARVSQAVSELDGVSLYVAILESTE